MRTEMWIGMCIDMCMSMCIDMCMSMCVDMCTDMCVGMCMNMGIAILCSLPKKVVVSAKTCWLWLQPKSMLSGAVNKKPLAAAAKQLLVAAKKG